MRIRKRHILNRTALLICMIGLFITAMPAFAANEFKLKPGATGKVCLKCHEAFKQELNKPFLHPLLKKRDCSGCHDPHTCSNEGLLILDPKRLCRSCHEDLIPLNARSAHPIVVEGKCVMCHDPHGATKKYNLKKAASELCIDCHDDIGERAQEVRFSHKPLKTGKGCLNCHEPHGAGKSRFLLKKNLPRLCKSCHKTDNPSFARRHNNFPVADSNCISCHDAHGSNKKGLLFDGAHAPFAEKKCEECHPGPSAKTAGLTKLKGNELCRRCHSEMIDEVLDKNRVHWPLVDRIGCLHCHTPHATKQSHLLKAPVLHLCGSCHADTVELQRLSISNPKSKNFCEPVKKGNCTRCHSPHASDGLLLIVQENISIDLCGACHDWQNHSSHPMGEKTFDNRNKNLTVECLSCHKGCGTSNNPTMMHFETTYDLCIQCHIDRKR